MRYLPLALVVSGTVLCLPALRALSTMLLSGAPDATALSTSSGMLLRSAIGAGSVVAGLVLMVLRRSRPRK